MPQSNQSCFEQKTEYKILRQGFFHLSPRERIKQPFSKEERSS